MPGRHRRGCPRWRRPVQKSVGVRYTHHRLGRRANHPRKCLHYLGLPARHLRYNSLGRKGDFAANHRSVDRVHLFDHKFFGLLGQVLLALHLGEKRVLDSRANFFVRINHLYLIILDMQEDQGLVEQDVAYFTKGKGSFIIA